MPFAELAKRYKKAKCIPAEYDGERKVAGMRAWKSAIHETDRLVLYFGNQYIQTITYSDIEQYKLHLLRTDTRFKRKRTIADVNHHLRRLRIVLHFARRNRWIDENPFAFGDPLISAADEMPRDRPRQKGEEAKLLAACTGRRTHMCPIIICAIDTAMRYGEIMRIRRSDVDLEAGTILVRALNTKTNRARLVPISSRLDDELRMRLKKVPDDPEALVFGGIGSVKTAWRALCEKAKITGPRFHDLRHWATTDIVDALSSAGIAPLHGMKITGHTQERTFRRYLRTDEKLVQLAGNALNELRRVREESADEQIAEAESTSVMVH